MTTLKISSKADMSSVLYEGRAILSEIADIPPMSEETWRDRLAAAIEKNGKTKRGVSLAAGLNPGYVHSLLVEGKDPTIDNLIAVCEQTGVALSYVMYGFEITAEAEEILRELAAAAPDQRKAMLTLLRKPSPETGEAQP